MRTQIVALAALVACSSAWAEAGKNDATKGEHGASGGSSAGSSSPGAEALGGGEGGITTDRTERQLGEGALFDLQKRFRFELGWEIHGLLYKNNYSGNGAETLFNYWYAGASYYLTPNDKLSLTAGLYRFALYDSGEPNGWRADDLLLRYNHHFALPYEIGLDAAASLTAPFSFESYKMGLVTEPQVRVAASRTFAKYVVVDARAFASYYWQTYTTMEGGSAPNPVARFGARLNVEGTVPFHRVLSFGLSVQSAYTSFYKPGSQPLGTPGVPSATGTVVSPGAVSNPLYTYQPLQQDYGFSIYAKYDLPKLPLQKLEGVKAQAVVAYAQGDGTAGYTPEQIDGVSNLYLFYPETSQLSFSLDLTY